MAMPTHPGKMVTVRVDASQTYQTIDGFGVNINARYWSPALLQAMDLLLNDLGATLYRVDIWGKSNWIDPTGELGLAALRPAHQARILSGEVFTRGWAMLRWLIEHGIQPYLTVSGDVPHWMLGPDGKTLANLDAFTDMLVTMLDWARNHEGLDIRLFGPLNETDLGSPEGPLVPPNTYVEVCEKLVEKLDARGLRDIQLVVPEQAHFTPIYMEAFAKSQKLRGRIAAFGLHTYSNPSTEDYKKITGALALSKHPNAKLWMSEYGDLEQSGEREWYVGWAMTTRLLDLLEAGFHGALVWDAFDNYHDHDEAWTIYGLLRNGLRLFTPKKRYYASKQVFRFVKPGFQRIRAISDTPGLRTLAFASPDKTHFTLVGLNDTPFTARLNVQATGLPDTLKDQPVYYYRTSETENTQTVARLPLHGPHWPFTGIDAEIPPASIFTITTEKD